MSCILINKTLTFQSIIQIYKKIILLLIMFKIHIQMKGGEVIIFNLFNSLDFTNFDVDENLFGFYLS